MDEYKPNSYKYKEEQKLSSEPEIEHRVEKVVSGELAPKKKNSSIFRELIAEDIGTVREYILKDVIIPAIQNTIEDIVTNGVHMLLRGESAKSSKSSNMPKVSYSKFYSQGSGDSSTVKRESSDSLFDEVIFNNRGDAEEVLSHLVDLIETYGCASILDYYDLIGHDTKFTDQKYGWNSLGSASVQRIREGYIIKFPRVKIL